MQGHEDGKKRVLNVLVSNDKNPKAKRGWKKLWILFIYVEHLQKTKASKEHSKPARANKLLQAVLQIARRRRRRGRSENLEICCFDSCPLLLGFQQSIFCFVGGPWFFGGECILELGRGWLWEQDGEDLLHWSWLCRGPDHGDDRFEVS